MKIQCSVCEAAEANVLCCADDAALCGICDQKVHAANKLASKHQRVPLSSSSSQMPKCDICQETVGYFFCLEDRALLCRKCDVAIHTANSLVSVHNRFLLTGVKVGQATEVGSFSSSGKKHTLSTEEISETELHSLPKRIAPVSSTGQCSKTSHVEASTVGDFSSSKMQFAGSAAIGSTSPLQLDELLPFGDFNQYYSVMDNGSYTADSGKLGDPECSPVLGSADLELEGDECLGHVPDTHLAVPQIVSPPIASGIYWPRSYQNPLEASVFVPDVSSMPLGNFHLHHHQCKHKRHF